MRYKHYANHHMRESKKKKPVLASNFNRLKRIEEEIFVYETAVSANNTK